MVGSACAAKAVTHASSTGAGCCRASRSGFNCLKECRHGLFLYNVNDEIVGRSLDLYGEYSEGEIDLLSTIVRKNDVVLDVGANVGAHTVCFAKMVGEGGSVLAWEPQRLIFQALCANVALNSLVNVHCFQKAVGSVDKLDRVAFRDPTKPANFGAVEIGAAHVSEPVAVIRLDSVPLPRCNLIKIDAEGMESQVIAGAVSLIHRFRPILYVENNRPHLQAQLVHRIASLGYVLYWHRPPLFNPNNFLKNSENVFKDFVSENMLCVPRTAPLDVRLRPVDVASYGML